MTLSHAGSPGRVDLLLRQVDYWRTVYRRTWKGSAITSFVHPLLYVAAMGVLLGGYVDQSSSGVSSLEGAPTYLAFVAPGLLAAHAMQVSTGEVMWPVMGAIRWDKSYYGMIATPLRPSDVVAGHLLFVLFRVATTCAVFAVVLLPFDVYASVPGAVLAFLASVLVGMAFATPVYGWTAGARTEEGFALIYRLGVMPMFLFSGAFFPISNLSPPLEALARLTPLWHGVDLARMSTLGRFDASAALVHVTYLGAMCAAGAWWSVRRLRRRLVA
jgi:lipooligosaccharide transport system permease protein